MDLRTRPLTFTGLLFAALFVAGMGLWEVVDIPAEADTNAEVVAFYEDTGNAWLVLIGGFLVVASSVGLYAWGELSSGRMAREGEASWAAISRWAFRVCCVGLVMGAIVLSALPAYVAFGGSADVEGGTGKSIQTAGYALLLVVGGVSAAVGVFCAERAMASTAMVPRAFRRVSFVAALFLLISFLFFPIFLLPLWVATAGWLIERRPAPSSSRVLRL